MRFLSSLVVVALTLLVSAKDLVPSGGPSEIIPGSYIVQLKEGAVLGRRSDLGSHAHFEAHMKRENLASKIGTKFDSPGVFTGAVLSSVSEDELAKVVASEEVLAVFPNRLVAAPTPFSGVSRFGPHATCDNPTDSFSTHQMTGVDKLHKKGIYGRGTKVAVIDTGIDWHHPALGNGCYGRGCKVAKGYDFVGDDFTGTGALVPDEDPMDCAGHGTHVAGIIGADSNPLNFTGVAPQATLFAHRVFGCEGSTQSSIIIEAMLLAHKDGADVISISIGGGAAWTEDAEAVVASRLVDAGVVISVSGGNSGDAGLWYTSAPQLGLGVIAVSSVNNVITPSKGAILSSGEGPIFLKGDIDSPGVEFPIFVSSLDTSVAGDACVPYPAGTDLTGRVALVRRGGCTFSVKAQNVLDARAAILLLYNNVPGETVGADIGTVPIQHAMITDVDGLAIIAALVANPAVTISFPDFYYNSPNLNTGGLVSDFTSYGLTADSYVKPQIGAPGGAILSTYPVAKGSYAVLDGTSMAAPFVSGVVSLFIATNGHVNPHTIQAILQSTSRPIATSVGGTELNTVAQQGAGLVDAFTAVLGSKTVITPSEIALNDTEHALTSVTIKISNAGSKSKTFSLRNMPAQAALTFGANGHQVNRDVPLLSGAASIAFSSTSVKVSGRGSAKVVLTFTPPTSLDPSTVPVYSGYVVVESTDERYVVPYAGTAANLRTDYPIIDNVDSPSLVTGAGSFISAPQNLSFIGGAEQLSIYYVLLGSSREVLIDLVPANTTFTPTIAKRHFTEKKMHRISQRRNSVVPTLVGHLSSEEYAYRNDPLGTTNNYNYFSISNAETGFFFSNGTKVPNGSYKVLLRGLRFYANDEYDSWLSPVITVNQA
ncbi:peptidase S8/S53 domain-containing protein [Mrakia frigida]|uniref:peptidase S8/S53 domain-containing protein n=1 Tax=Mrakia frigida TaxID=29902 RepID=UPI003FCC1FC8